LKTGKIIIFSGPSGSGKTTIVKHLLKKENLSLAFSISATSRLPRKGEINGKDYFFLKEKDFVEKVKNDEFIEHEEVYPGSFYGTLKNEINRIWGLGKNIIFDIDVIGGLNIKKKYPPVNIHLDTSQHTHKFFEKFGFIVRKISNNGYGEGLDMYDMILGEVSKR